jgi:hypothetical protein
MSEQLHILYIFYLDYRSKTLDIESYTPGQRELLKRWAVFFMELWMTSPRFRQKASSEHIHRCIKEFYPDEFKELYIYHPSVVIHLWRIHGFGQTRVSNKAKGLKDSGSSYNSTMRLMFDIKWETFVDLVLQDNSNLLKPSMFLGKDQKQVSEEFGIPKRLVKRIFSHLVSTGGYKIAMKRVPSKSSPIRALVEVCK